MKSRIRNFQKRSEARKRHEATSDKSPSKKLRYHHLGPVGNTPGRTKLAERMGELDINSPKRKRDDSDAVVMDEKAQYPSKRMKTENGEDNPFMIRSEQSPPTSPTPETGLLNSCSRRERPAKTPADRSSHQEHFKESSLHRSLTEFHVKSRESVSLHPHFQLSSEEKEERNETISPSWKQTRQIPLCGTRREVFLDRKPWLEIDSKMQKHLARFKSLLQSLDYPR